MKNACLGLVAIFGLSFSLFGTPAFAATTYREVINNVSENVILKTYQDFAASTSNLKIAVDLLVAQPNQQNLEIAQQAWRDARGAYEVSEGFLFGPMDSLGIDPMIDTWPLALTELKTILASTYPLDVDSVRSLGTNVLGFHAAEFILFGEGITTNTRDAKTLTARELQYLTATTVLLKEQTDLLLYAWTSHNDPEDGSSPSYIDVIKNPGAQNQFYSSEAAVIQEFANGILGIIAEAGKAKLPDATGETPQDANARLEESPFSWNSIADYTSNVDSVLNIYTGAYRGQTGPGLKALVAEKNPELAERVETQMLRSRQLILAIPGPEGISFGRAIKTNEGRTRIFAAIASLGELEKTLEDEVLPLLQ